MKKKICKNCGKIFIPSRKEYETCSRICGNYLRKIKNGSLIKCDYCGRSFFKKKYGQKKCDYNFCSSKCYTLWRRINLKGIKNPNWRGGIMQLRTSGDKKLRQKGMNTKSKGNCAELEVKKILTSMGYFVMKAGGSFGIWDLWAIDNKNVRMIQVKSTCFKRNFENYFKKDIQKMKDVKDRVIGIQELWIRKTRVLTKGDPLKRYLIIKI